MTSRRGHLFAQSVADTGYLTIDGRFVRMGWYAKRCPGLAERLSERPMGDIVNSANQKSNQIWEYGMVGWQEYVRYALWRETKPVALFYPSDTSKPCLAVSSDTDRHPRKRREIRELMFLKAKE